MHKEKFDTPIPTLRRLPKYLHLLVQLQKEGIKEISSTYIANELSLDPTQVRKDIEHTNIKGKPRVGYNLVELIVAIQKFLSWDIINNTIIVGVGHLGFAMLGYPDFIKYGLKFTAAFDSSELLIGKKVNNVPIFDVKELSTFLKRNKIKCAVLTVPAKAAQDVADIMIEGGVKAIWNFAPRQLKVPDNIVVENATLTQSLAVLTNKLAALREP